MTCRTDSFPTATSKEQARVEEILLQHRPPNDQPKPHLQRPEHLNYLLRNLRQGFPERFISQDCSQTWLVYWTLHSFSLLGVALDPETKQRAIDTIMACQHPDGGFGGGPGQAPHVLPTYAAISALASVGRAGPGGGWDQIDRLKLYKFFLSLKQRDGSFLVAHHSEVDVRGTYCLLCVAALLNLITPELIKGTAEFIASLQTYEGGFASASQPYFSPDGSGEEEEEVLLKEPRPALGEAHGGYTFCALASWVMLHPLLPLLSSSGTSSEQQPTINTRNLVRWLVQMQGSEAELGGFRGRTNKLVDACYSWWVGGAFNLLRPLGVGTRSATSVPTTSPPTTTPPKGEGKEEEDAWTDDDESLFNRAGLQEYILYAAQHKAGGLRDKPPKIADSYHTLYSLAGLASAQHNVFQVDETKEKLRAAWKPKEGDDPALDEFHKTVFAEARAWTEEVGGSNYVNGKVDRVNATHPIFNLTITHVRLIMNHFYAQE
ncbi:terpenoid cyclases/Protein prenyltransferase [Rickenella mellea]|uniref:Protein farnesyltransferase subunit beta n=1 Tax=Rickenella mellea TaxID=50990 RepID=A0A4Y7PT41_9AGAM|nr:terpenoid cyclases/Protein prenyltransferase [Rickenella mellea]